MRSEPVVAAPASQPKPEIQDYFSLLGVPRKFSQDTASLQKRYYELSRELHPDRFAASRPEVRQRSLEQMSLLNEAYSTLKDRELLRAYLLELEGIQVQKASAPMDLASAWFELQDVLMEDPERAVVKIAEFENELLAKKTELETQMRLSADSYDSTGAREWLERLAHLLQTLNYLNSLERDVSRLKAKYGHSN